MQGSQVRVYRGFLYPKKSPFRGYVQTKLDFLYCYNVICIRHSSCLFLRIGTNALFGKEGRGRKIGVKFETLAQGGQKFNTTFHLHPILAF